MARATLKAENIIEVLNSKAKSPQAKIDMLAIQMLQDSIKFESVYLKLYDSYIKEEIPNYTKWREDNGHSLKVLTDEAYYEAIISRLKEYMFFRVKYFKKQSYRSAIRDAYATHPKKAVYKQMIEDLKKARQNAIVEQPKVIEEAAPAINDDDLPF